MILVFFIHFIYLFVYATTNIQRSYKISNVMTKTNYLTRSYIKIRVTIISLVDSD